jgi:hypothetical protein
VRAFELGNHAHREINSKGELKDEKQTEVHRDNACPDNSRFDHLFARRPDVARKCFDDDGTKAKTRSVTVLCPAQSPL